MIAARRARTNLDAKVRGLIVLMVGAASLEVCENIKGQDAIGLWVLDLLAHSCRLGLLRVALVVMKRPAFSPFEYERRCRTVCQSRQQAVFKGTVAVAHLTQLIVYLGVMGD